MNFIGEKAFDPEGGRNGGAVTYSVAAEGTDVQSVTAAESSWSERERLVRKEEEWRQCASYGATFRQRAI